MLHRFADIDGSIYENEDSGAQGLTDLVKEIWITRRYREQPLPFQLVDELKPEIVLRFVHELPEEYADGLEPEQLSALAHAVCAKFRGSSWKVLWSVPILSDLEVGEPIMWFTNLSPEEMRQFR